MLIFNNTISLVSLAIVSIYLIITAIVSFDKKQIRLVKKGVLPSNFTLLPLWMEYLYWFELGLLVVMLIINWELGLIVFALKLSFQYLGVLQKAGGLLIQYVRKLKAS
ncbi:hypothetical protein [Desertivirga brevis]|uniref:hypothetical protein n=1 Tax=Desertivirga brevis TaxID=2810310 RepID=UPI001A96FA61|nr:hypothetical protein [Pedobacter sp. SYSU D00873]